MNAQISVHRLLEHSLFPMKKFGMYANSKDISRVERKTIVTQTYF